MTDGKKKNRRDRETDSQRVKKKGEKESGTRNEEERASGC